MNKPPSIVSTCPVMYLASGERRNATAPETSSGVPNRPRGTFFSRVSLISSVRTSVSRVSMNPGAIALTVMPREPTSLAVDLVSPTSPALAAAVICLTGVADQSDNGGHVDNAS